MSEIQRQALARDLVLRLQRASYDELRAVELVVQRLEQLGDRSRPRPPADELDACLAAQLDDLYAERRDREQRHEADRDEMVDEWREWPTLVGELGGEG